MLVSLSGYLLLTAPIDNAIYGYFRGVVLLLTELLPYFLWLYVFVLIKPEIRTQDIHWLIKIAMFAMFGMFLWLFYCFAILQGRSSFHQVNHMLGIVFYGHIAFMAIYDFQDDLVQKRRKTRIVMAVLLGTYSSCLAVLEIFDYSLRAEPLFSVINSATILMLIFIFSTLAVKNKHQAPQSSEGLPSRAPQETIRDSIPAIFRTDLEKMKLLMEQQFYTQSNLTIGVLAEALDMPEHRLRLLINKHLGYQNFSVFLNSYRITAAIVALKDPLRVRLPVLTIALELGFGSIGPFNRAFKQTTGVTPSEFRKKIQNRS